MIKQKGKIHARMLDGDLLSWSSPEYFASVDYGVLCIRRVWNSPDRSSGTQTIFMAPKGAWKGMWFEETP